VTMPSGEVQKFLFDLNDAEAASGIFVTRYSAGTTPAKIRRNLALPLSNTAEFESPVALTRNQMLLEGNVAPQLQCGSDKTGGGVASRNRRRQIHRSSQTMTTFSGLMTSIVSDLRQGGFIKDADELQHLANLALDQTLLADTRKDALKQIEMRCHVKWLGDFYLPHLSKKDWWGRLEKLGRSTKKHLQSI